MAEQTRKEKFEKIYSMRDREEFAADPKALIGFMMDYKFQQKDINMVWYLTKTCPEALSEVISRRTDIKKTSEKITAKTRLDKEILKELLIDMSRGKDRVRCYVWRMGRLPRNRGKS